MSIHLVNPSDTAFGTAVITPRWLYVLAAATDGSFGDPEICDETLEHLNLERVKPGDVVGIGIHTGNALRGYEVGRAARERGAWVVFGGIHSTLYSEEPFEYGGAHAVVKGDGDIVWNKVIRDCVAGTPERIYNGGRVEARGLQASPLGFAAVRQLYVGIGADGSWMRQTLFFLFRMAYGWATSPSARHRRRDRGNRRAAPARLPLHRLGGRQFLSGHHDRHRQCEAAEQPGPGRSA